jgi:bifunctional DNA-binding transcriptional regulator/antitoxin component of YhaV-PrlF toxin-antitoxin module
MSESRVLGYVTIDREGRGSFPLAVREALQLDEGTQLRLEQGADGRVELVPVMTVPRDQLYFHTPEMQARITRAEQSFTEGTSTRTHSEKETIAFLDRLKVG